MAKKTVKIAKEPSPSVSSSSVSSSSSSSSSDSEDERSSSASPEPEQQRKVKAAQGVDVRSSKYRPPKGLKLVSGTVGRSAVDFDDVKNNPDLELWAVRVPTSVKTSALDGVVLKLPSEPTRDPVATFKPKKGTAEYDVFVVPADEHKAGQKRRRDDDDEEEKLGGEEMQSLVPLLPCKSRGDKLFQATQPIARSLIITRHLPTSLSSFKPSSLRPSSLIASQPSPVPGAILSSGELLQPEVAQAKKIVREQPRGLQMRINLPGMGKQGGQGHFFNPPEAVLPPRFADEDEDADMQEQSATEEPPAVEREEEQEERAASPHKKAKKDKGKKDKSLKQEARDA